MADIEHFSEDINQRMMDPKNNVASQGAYDIVSMAAASAVQNELAMHSGFETTSNTC
uniref:RebC n=1 Tax=Caedibacter taeniospiralis TaxID=28907 RepID=Q57487_CAETA|nr:RebC [Caedibacter taeniospiralis]AAA73410.1 RebC [Caedibacter taeniospiralis]prf//2014290C rebC gene [Caedibacter taeniospiralis]